MLWLWRRFLRGSGSTGLTEVALTGLGSTVIPGSVTLSVTSALSGTSSPVLRGTFTTTVDDGRTLMGRYRAGRRERQ